MKCKFIVLSIVISVLFSGCATMLAPEGGDTVLFSSDFDNVNVSVNGKQVGKLKSGQFDYKFQRSNKGPKEVVFSKPGYKDTKVVVRRELAPSFWANILGNYFSTTSSAVDMVNGNAYEHTPNQFHITMFEKED